MSIRKKLDISAYLVIGPENRKERSAGKIIKAAIIELYNNEYKLF